jgi:FtsP/CotA-like multicopper oxidase with cupredoxin domain
MKIIYFNRNNLKIIISFLCILIIIKIIYNYRTIQDNFFGKCEARNKTLKTKKHPQYCKKCNKNTCTKCNTAYAFKKGHGCWWNKCKARNRKLGPKHPQFCTNCNKNTCTKCKTKYAFKKGHGCWWNKCKARNRKLGPKHPQFCTKCSDTDHTCNECKTKYAFKKGHGCWWNKCKGRNRQLGNNHVQYCKQCSDTDHTCNECNTAYAFKKNHECIWNKQLQKQNNKCNEDKHCSSDMCLYNKCNNINILNLFNSNSDSDLTIIKIKKIKESTSDTSKLESLLLVHSINENTQEYNTLPLIILNSNTDYGHPIGFQNVNYDYKGHGTNIHFHNLQTDPYSDGSNMEQMLGPGEDKIFKPSLNIKEKGIEKTLIYHTHTHGVSANIAKEGCYGMTILAPKMSKTEFSHEYLTVYDHPIVLSGGFYSLILNSLSNKEGEGSMSMSIDKNSVHRFRIACAYSSYQDYSVIKIFKKDTSTEWDTSVDKSATTFHIADEDGLIHIPRNIDALRNSQPIISSGNRYEILVKFYDPGEYEFVLFNVTNNVTNMSPTSLVTLRSHGKLLCNISVKKKDATSDKNPYLNYWNIINPPDTASAIADSESVMKIEPSLQNGLVNWNMFNHKQQLDKNIIIYPSGMDMLWNVTDNDYTNGQFFRNKNYGTSHAHHNTHEFTITCDGLPSGTKITLSESYKTIVEFTDEINNKITDKFAFGKNARRPVFSIEHTELLNENSFLKKQLDPPKPGTPESGPHYDFPELYSFKCLVGKWKWKGIPSKENEKIDIKCNTYMANILGLLETDYLDKTQEDLEIIKNSGNLYTFNVTNLKSTANVIGHIFTHGFVNKTYKVSTNTTKFVEWLVINVSGFPHNFHHHLFQAKANIPKSSKIYSALNGLKYIGHPEGGEFIKKQIGKDTWITPNKTFLTLICPIIKIPVSDATKEKNSLIKKSDWDVPYMAHCHFLPHEDMGMMSTFRVI